jgi:hypothetical protein
MKAHPRTRRSSRSPPPTGDELDVTGEEPGTILIPPPEHLREDGKDLFTAVQRERRINSVETTELLLRCAELSDRLTDLRKAIEHSGVEDVALVRVETACRAQLLRGMRSLERLTGHPNGNAPPKPPRWMRHFSQSAWGRSKAASA